ncbi:MAG TPA: hypothetical protein VGN11_01650 [Candidatus Baltobacteraceae bacterium]|nr:hypothetical protein [Candidatus Baltobacteraceae bacterium]
MQQRLSLLAEFGWLAFFLVVFALLVYAFNLFVVPHHFNDRIAIVISAIIAGVVMIAARAKYTQRTR